jgi:hypothetical protein
MGRTINGLSGKFIGLPVKVFADRTIDNIDEEEDDQQQSFPLEEKAFPASGLF